MLYIVITASNTAHNCQSTALQSLLHQLQSSTLLYTVISASNAAHNCQSTALQSLLHQLLSSTMIDTLANASNTAHNCQSIALQSLLHQLQSSTCLNTVATASNKAHDCQSIALHLYASQRILFHIIRALLVNNSNELTHQQQNYDKQQISRSRDVLLCLTAKSRTSRSLVRLPRTRVVSSRASTCSAVMNLSNTTSQHTHHPHHSILLVIYRVLLKK